MTAPTGKQTDSASLDGGSPPVQLPAYSESDNNSNGGFEMVHAPESPSQPTYMTAEQEKAYLAEREQPEAIKDLQPNPHVQPSGPWKEQHHTSPPTPSNIHEQPRGADPSTQSLSRGLQVPSSHRKVSSGFPYPDILSTYGISPKEWSNFTSEITQAAQLSNRDWSITVGAGVATFAASGILIGWAGLIPAVAVGHLLRCSKEHKNLRAARDTGDLETQLLRWNETTFAPRGFLVRLDLPGEESGDLDRMDVYTARQRGLKWGSCRNARTGSSNGQGWWAQRAQKRAQCSRRQTAARGRIVIVPLNGVHRSTTESTAKDVESVDHNPLSVSEKGFYTGTDQEV